MCPVCPPAVFVLHALHRSSALGSGEQTGDGGGEHVDPPMFRCRSLISKDRKSLQIFLF